MNYLSSCFKINVGVFKLCLIEIGRRNLVVGGQDGGEAFISEGFNLWDKKSRLKTHVGKVGSVHNFCVKAS